MPAGAARARAPVVVVVVGMVVPVRCRLNAERRARALVGRTAR